MKVSNIFTFLAGAAIGAAAALLFAPDSGANTRKKIRQELKKHGLDLSEIELNELISRFRNKKVAEGLEA